MPSCLLVAAQEGDAHPLGALPVGTLVNNIESEPGRGAQYIRAAGMAQKPPHPATGETKGSDITVL